VRQKILKYSDVLNQRKIVITDASCFITLDKIDSMHLLHSLYKQVITTPEIAAEYGKRLPDWVDVKAVLNRNLLYNYAETVDIGEASAMALASEIYADLLIIDDAGGRRFAKKLKLNITGTIGVILSAKLNGIIPSVKPFIIKIQQTNFRISEWLTTQIINEAGENLS
jgi:predicted nucleic acid-binding protein